MAEYSRIAEGKVIATDGPLVINLPFIPSSVEVVNQDAYANGPAGNSVISLSFRPGMAQGTGLIQGYSPIGTNPLIGDFVASGGITTFAAGDLLSFGPRVAISSSSKGSTTAFTTSSNHGLFEGDTVILTGLYNSPSTTGMAQMSNMPFEVVTVSNATTFYVDWDSSGSNYTNLSSPPNAFVKKVLYPFIYFPNVAFINSVSSQEGTGNAVIGTTAKHNYVVGQEVAFRVPPQWGPVELNSLPDPLIPGSPVYYYVTDVLDDLTFVINVLFSSLTPFNDNQPISSVPGLDYPQSVPAGDINSGGWPYTGGNLYPSPVSGSGFGSPTINGPAIMGAFVNNTSQGFIIGTGIGSTVLGSIGQSPGDELFYRAVLDDLVLV